MASNESATRDLPPGSRVRVRSNPNRVGTVTDETDGAGARLKLLVAFPEGEEFVLAASLERVERDQPQGPDALIRMGRYGRVDDLRGAITYYRLTGRLANLLYSLNATNTEFLPYQFKPVLQFLESPVKGLLIADEVGLGKTIEAGLIWTELRAREDARRLLVVCPAMLTEKWRHELRARFGLTAEIVKADELKNRLANLKENPTDDFALICSMQGLRPPRDWEHPDGSQSASAKLARMLRDAEIDEALFDLTIIDEAHYLRNPSTLTNKLAGVLRPVSQYIVMLSATPIQLGSQDLFSLLHLLDPDTFQDQKLFDQTLEANAPLVDLRDRILRGPITKNEFIDSLHETQKSNLFAGNEQIQYLLQSPPTASELTSPRDRSLLSDQLDRINPLAKVVTRTLKRDVQTQRPTRDPKAIRVELTATERHFYDEMTQSVRGFCQAQDISEGFIVTLPQRQMASSLPAALEHWLERGEKAGLIDEEEANELGLEQLEDPIVDANASVSDLMRHIVTEARRLGDLRALTREDRKYAKLVDALKSYWASYPGAKVVLFSYFKRTLAYLSKRLQEENIQSVLLYGGMDKEDCLQRFRDADDASILLSSEVAAEGVDLQFCSVLINYDLPWNPAKVEQRIGRIDRIGQQASRILVYNFMYADTVDERIHDRLHERLGIFQQALGSMEMILGDKVAELTSELLNHNLSARQQEEKIDQKALAIENEKRQRESLEEQATHLIAHGDFIQRKVQAAQDLGRYIKGEDLYKYVTDYMHHHYPGSRFVLQSEQPITVDAELSSNARNDLIRIIEEENLRGSTKIPEGKRCLLEFNNRPGSVTKCGETVTQGHPLVRLVTAGLQSGERVSPYNPLSAIQIAREECGYEVGGDWAYLVCRWSFEGVRTIEQLEYFMIGLEGGELLDGEVAEFILNAAALRGRDWDSVHNVVDGDNAAKRVEQCREENEGRFERFHAMQKRENRDRIRIIINGLESHRYLTKQKIKERIDYLSASGSANKKRMLPLEEGKIRKLDKKIDERILRIRRQEEVTGDHQEVSAGVLRVLG